MRKAFLLLLLACGLALVSVPAAAETYVFDDIYGTVDIPEGYVVLTDKNLSDYTDWLEAHGSTLEESSNDFLKRGVLLQAWSEDGTARFELRATQTDQTKLIFDINEQSQEVRGDYRTSHYPRNEYEGYEFSASEWKNTDNGRFLVLRYVRRESGEILYRGFMRRTIRNGYQIDFDMQILNRSTTNKDNTNLNKIWDSFRFVEILPLPPAASAKINITDAPPEETKNQSFDISGYAAEGVKLTAVVMGLSYPDPVVSEVTVGKNGKFALPIKLPREGVFLITITGEYQDEEVVELAYPVTYQRTLLTVNFTTKPGDVVNQDEVTFSGTGEPGASIQIFVNGEAAGSKRVTTAGKFLVTVDAKEEGSYEVTLVFTKKNLADRRFTFTFTRRWTDQDMLQYLKKQAIKPTYKQLINKMQGYEGRIMGYSAYIVDISESGGDFIIRMALNRKNGKYSNFILVTASESPSFEVGQRVTMYGTCEGMSLSTSTDESGEQEENLPCFNLLLFVAQE